MCIYISTYLYIYICKYEGQGALRFEQASSNNFGVLKLTDIFLHSNYMKDNGLEIVRDAVFINIYLFFF